MTFIDNTEYNRKAATLFNQAATVAVTSSLALFEQQMDYARKNADRNLSRLASFPTFNSPEEVVQFQQKVGENEMTELKKAGASCYKIADDAGQQFVSVAKEGYELLEESFGEVAEKVGSVLPNGKAALFSDLVTQPAKMANDIMLKGFDAVVQATRNGADTVAVAVAEVPVASAKVVKTAKNGKAAAATRRKQTRK